MYSMLTYGDGHLLARIHLQLLVVHVATAATVQLESTANIGGQQYRYLCYDINYGW